MSQHEIESNKAAPSTAHAALPWLIGLVIVAAILAHWPALNSKAVSFDDHQYLLENPLVKSPSWQSAWRFLTEVRRPSTVAGYYQPLSMISLMLDVALGGGPENFYPLHRTSLILHGLNTGLIALLLYLLFRQPWPAALTALLFGVHPLTIEPIPWVGERKTLLATFFALLCLICYARYVVTRSNGTKKAIASKGTSHWRWYTAAVVAYLLALMAKPTVVPLAILLILLDWWPLRRLSRATIVEKAPFLVLCGVFAYITVVSQGTASTATLPTEYPASRIPLVLCHNIVFYLSKMACPSNLSAHYPFPQPLSLENTRMVVGIAGTAILLIVLALSLKRTRALAAGWLVFFIAIFPTMQVIGFSDVIASDKYAYFPAIGILLIVAWAIAAAWKQVVWRKIVTAAVVLAAGAEAYATRSHLAVWKDTLTHYQYMLSKAPDSAALHNNIAVAYASMGQYDEAIKEYGAAMDLQPGDERTITNIGVAIAKSGRRDPAIAFYQKALLKLPNCYSIHTNLGALLAEADRGDEALEHYRIARMLKPDSAEARANYGNGLYVMGRMPEAIVEYTAALELRADLPEIHNNLAAALGESGRKEEAIQHYQMACALNPNYADAHQNIALRLGEVGRLDEAIEHIKIAIKLRPENADGIFLLAQLQVNRGDIEAAIKALREVIALDKQYTPAHELLRDLLLPTSQPTQEGPVHKP